WAISFIQAWHSASVLGRAGSGIFDHHNSVTGVRKGCEELCQFLFLRASLKTRGSKKNWIFLARLPIAFAPLGRLQIDAVENQRQLRDIDLQLCLVLRGRRTLKAATFQALVVDRKSIAFKCQQLQPIAPPINEHEPMA